MATARDLCVSALKEIGVLDSTETGSLGEVDDALTQLNRLLDLFALDPATAFYRIRTTATLTASQASFSVGSGGNIDITRPVFIHHVNYIDTAPAPDLELPLAPFTEDEWAALAVKAQTATRPSRWYYNPTYPTGTLYPWPIPTDSGLQWALYHSAAVSQFSTLATAVSLPPGYEEMLVKNLAVALAPQFQATPSPLTVRAAMESLGDIRNTNRRRRVMAFEAGALIGGGGVPWDIRTGQ